jgi:hypothetical protein
MSTCTFTCTWPVQLVPSGTVAVRKPLISLKAGDRSRTGDNLLGKQGLYH